MNKIEAYNNLVSSRKNCSLCEGLCNPSAVEDGRWDSEQIGPWSLWQGNLNAQIMVIGQDWGDLSYFMKWEGKDQPSGNPTNSNLKQLLKDIGIQILSPRDKQQNIIFLTNIILCLKKDGLQGKVKREWFENCSNNFLNPLIDIIKPELIVSLGKMVSESILDLYEIPYSKNAKLSHLLEQSPLKLTPKTYLFPMYHCGAGGVNRNRPIMQQKRDWEKVKNWTNKNGKQKRDSTEDRIIRTINKYESASSFIIPKYYEGAGSGKPFPRLYRATVNQIEDSSNAVFSRYGIWANTVRDYILEAANLITRNPDKALELLEVAANNLSAFSEIQEELDPLKNNDREK